MAFSLAILSVLALCGVATASVTTSSRANRTDSARAPTPRIYLNQWAVEIRAGPDVAKVVAAQTQFEFLSPVGSLENYYIFRHPLQEKHANSHAADKTAALLSHEKVLWAEQQLKRYMIKKPAMKSSSEVTHGTPYLSPIDAWYYKQWYYNKQYEDPKPAWNRGFTGLGTTVVLIDDGVDYTHPDLAANYERSISYDYIDFDNDPNPTFDIPDEDGNRHGTRCAGEIVAASNEQCVVGIAYNATFGAIRLIGGEFSDATEAAAVSHSYAKVDVYSNSWGPHDDGKTFGGPGTLARAAFLKGQNTGRNNLGSIYVFAAGNGRQNGDNCAADGFSNLISTVSVTAADQFDTSAWYAEHCSAVMVTSYSSGDDYMPQVATTDLDDGCTDKHTGTSAATPKVAAVIALALQANPTLTWRDVHHLLALTSRHDNLDPSVLSNAAGYKHSNAFGFGMINTAGMVNLAQHWTNVDAQQTCYSSNGYNECSDCTTSSTATITMPATCEGSQNINYLEHVIVTVSASNTWARGYITLDLVSPSGTKSRILADRPNDDESNGFTEWQFKSLAFWGEGAAGQWALQYGTTDSTWTTSLLFAALTLYGTETAPAITSLPNVYYCHAQCHGGCVGPLDTQCDTCSLYTLFLEDGGFQCVEECPVSGYTREGSRCMHCAAGEICPSFIELPTRVAPTAPQTTALQTTPYNWGFPDFETTPYNWDPPAYTEDNNDDFISTSTDSLSTTAIIGMSAGGLVGIFLLSVIIAACRSHYQPSGTARLRSTRYVHLASRDASAVRIPSTSAHIIGAHPVLSSRIAPPPYSGPLPPTLSSGAAPPSYSGPLESGLSSVGDPPPYPGVAPSAPEGTFSGSGSLTSSSLCPSQDTSPESPQQPVPPSEAPTVVVVENGNASGGGEASVPDAEV